MEGKEFIKKLKDLCKAYIDYTIEHCIDDKIKNTVLLVRRVNNTQIIESLIGNTFDTIFEGYPGVSWKIHKEYECKKLIYLPDQEKVILKPSVLFFIEQYDFQVLEQIKTEGPTYILNALESTKEKWIFLDKCVYSNDISKHVDYISFIDKSIKVDEKEYIVLEDIISLQFPTEKEQILSILDNTINEMNKICKLTLAELKKLNNNMFNDVVFEKIISEKREEIALSDNEINKIKKYLFNRSDYDKIIKMLYTFLATNHFFNKNEDQDYFDLTFITVSIFKVVEIIFNDLLNKRWGNKVITDEKGRNIHLNKDSLTLGQMNQIFTCDDREIKEFFKYNSQYLNELIPIMTRWISKTRNGFLHKDIIDGIDIKLLEESIKDTITILCLLIVIFY